MDAVVAQLITDYNRILSTMTTLDEMGIEPSIQEVERLDYYSELINAAASCIT